MKKLKKGFSLLELIVVLTVIGIIGTFGYSKFTEVMMEAKSEQLSNQLNKIEVGLNQYYSELGTYPLDVHWLVADSMDKTTADLFDSLSMKMDGTEDEDVKQYWSGPYIKDMKTPIDPSKPDRNTIQAVFGDQIKVCATVTGGIVTHSAAPTSTGSGSLIVPCGTDVTSQESHINVLLIKGIDAEALKFLFKQINGREMTEGDKTFGNAYDVANNTGEFKADKLGVPARANYSEANPYVIYRFTDNIQNN